MPSIFAVLAKTTDNEQVLDSVWEKVNWASNRRDHIWSYPEIYMAEVQEIELNKFDPNTIYELMKDYDEDDYGE